MRRCACRTQICVTRLTSEAEYVLYDALRDTVKELLLLRRICLAFYVTLAKPRVELEVETH